VSRRTADEAISELVGRGQAVAPDGHLELGAVGGIWTARWVLRRVAVRSASGRSPCAALNSLSQALRHAVESRRSDDAFAAACG
jgi:putative aminopeptidase FrvX